MTGFVSSDPLNNLTNTYQRPLFIGADRAPRDIRTYPTSADIQPPGTQWQNDSTSPAAIYETNGGGYWYLADTHNVAQFTGNTGTAVPDSNQNVNILGTSGQINVAASGSTLTLSLTGGGTAVDTLLTDDGAPAVPPTAGGQITLTGGNGIVTSGQSPSNTVTIDMQSPFTGNFNFIGNSPVVTVTATTGSAEFQLNGASGGDANLFIASSGVGGTSELSITSDTETAEIQVGSPLTSTIDITSGVYPTYTASTLTGAQFSWGIANSGSATDPFVIVGPGNLSSTAFFKLSSTGCLNLPLQPCFWAQKTVTSTNATGDGTIYSVICDSELFDQSNSYDHVTGLFTAPIDGKYVFYFVIGGGAFGAAHTYSVSDFWRNGAAQLVGQVFNPFAVCELTGGFTTNWMGHVILSLSAAETVGIRVQVSNGTKTVSVIGGGNGSTTFSGFLIC